MTLLPNNRYFSPHPISFDIILLIFLLLFSFCLNVFVQLQSDINKYPWTGTSVPPGKLEIKFVFPRRPPFITFELFLFLLSKVVYHHERLSTHEAGLTEKDSYTESSPILVGKMEGIIMHADGDDMATTVEYFYVFYSFVLRIIISVGKITAHNNQE